jgi:hypothetical protein
MCLERAMWSRVSVDKVADIPQRKDVKLCTQHWFWRSHSSNRSPTLGYVQDHFLQPISQMNQLITTGHSYTWKNWKGKQNLTNRNSNRNSSMHIPGFFKVRAGSSSAEATIWYFNNSSFFSTLENLKHDHSCHFHLTKWLWETQNKWGNQPIKLQWLASLHQMKVSKVDLELQRVEWYSSISCCTGNAAPVGVSPIYRSLNPNTTQCSYSKFSRAS